jgi:uncharacterized membrane protein
LNRIAFMQPLLGPYSPDFGVYSDAQAYGMNDHGGVAGVTFVPAYDPTVSELLHMVGATWQQANLVTSLTLDSESVLHSLNDSGIAVGIRGFNNSTTEIAIVVDGGNTTDLTPAVGQGAQATDINNAGMICGWSWNTADAFVYSLATSSVVELIPPLSGQNSRWLAQSTVQMKLLERAGIWGFASAPAP